VPSLSKEFRTVADIAQTLRVNQQTVRNRIDAGKRRVRHVGRVPVTCSDFDRYTEQGYFAASDAIVPGQVEHRPRLPGRSGASATRYGPSAFRVTRRAMTNTPSTQSGRELSRASPRRAQAASSAASARREKVSAIRVVGRLR
jgi:hypothetical protein